MEKSDISSAAIRRLILAFFSFRISEKQFFVVRRLDLAVAIELHRKMSVFEKIMQVYCIAQKKELAAKIIAELIDAEIAEDSRIYAMKRFWLVKFMKSRSTEYRMIFYRVRNEILF